MKFPVIMAAALVLVASTGILEAGESGKLVKGSKTYQQQRIVGEQPADNANNQYNPVRPNEVEPAAGAEASDEAAEQMRDTKTELQQQMKLPRKN